MKRLFWLLLGAIYLHVLYRGVMQFDQAHNGLEVFKGLFWILIGALACRNSFGRAKAAFRRTEKE